jgi:hypothetical protein
MTHSPDSLVPSGSGQPELEKRDDKALTCRKGGEANLWAATEVNAVTASSYPPAIMPTQLEFFPGRACPLEAKPDMDRNQARRNSVHRHGVEGGGTQRQRISTTGETLFGPAEATPPGREAYKGETRKRRNDAEQGVGGGHSTDEPRENRGEGRAATSIIRPMLEKAAGLPPQGKASPRPNRAKRKAPARLDNACKLQRTLYRVAKLQPERVTCPVCGACRWKKMVGELDAGNSHVQFDEGAQETCGSATRLCPTLPSPAAGGVACQPR